MKIVKILVIGLLTALALGTSVNASANVSNSSLAVISQVVPEVSHQYANSKFKLVFVVNEKGEVSNIAAESKLDPKLVEVFASAIKQWKFVPTYRDGTPVSTKVVLPVVING